MIFWQGMQIVSGLLQVAGVFAAAIIGGVLIISIVCFVIGGVLKFWFDCDKRDGLSGAERCWERIFGAQGWSSESEDEGERMPPPPPPHAQNVMDGKNLCVCRSCSKCDAHEAKICPSRKCEVCEPRW